MKSFLKKLIPDPWLDFYHLALARFAALIYNYPSRQMIVIGVTGTSGKSTTVNLIAKVLEQAGHKVGIISTVNFKVAEREWLNNLKMTMPGRFYLQKLLRQMVSASCNYAIIETSSEGILQHRHLGIDYDVAIFTNLAAEHLSSHGGFQNYKQAKLKLFEHLVGSKTKTIREKKIEKMIIANADDRHAKEFLNFSVDKKITFSVKSQADFQATDIQLSNSGAKFLIHNSRLPSASPLARNRLSAAMASGQANGGQAQFLIHLLGKFNIYNALAAIATTVSLSVDLNNIKEALSQVPGIPGRMEKVEANQPFTVLVDYGFEPGALHQTYETIKQWGIRKIIHILGSTGGGRDKSRRPILGYIAGTNADLVIVTNEDPYDDDPREIIDDVAKGASEAGKQEGKDLKKILDRREAIHYAFGQAEKNDLVLITGKGSEQAMVVKNNKKIPWDDRQVAREELKKLGY